MSLKVIDMNGLMAYPPRTSDLSKRFWDKLAEGEFETTECKDCGKLTFPPKKFCPHCWSRNVEWVSTPTRGTIYSYTTVHIAPAVFAHEAPYMVCIADMDGGLRIATRLVGAENGVTPDDPVELVALKYDDASHFAVRPVETAG